MAKKFYCFDPRSTDYVDNSRTSRSPERRKSPDWNAADAYLRVQSEPPQAFKGQGQPQPIREEIILDDAKVRKLYPTLERKNSRQNNLVYRSESKREPKRYTYGLCFCFLHYEGDITLRF